jgi:uncharacterized protein
VVPCDARFSCPRIVALVLPLLLLALPGKASGAGWDELYRTQTIVTGQREDTRAKGFATALEAVLVKVSGDPRLIGDPRVEALAGEAGASVESFRYRDRMEGMPVHDEQGTRDRPHDLFVSFDPGTIDAMLRSLGRERWPVPRPRVAVFLGVENGPTRYMLASDGKRGRDQREALAAAADALGLPLAMPSEAALAKAGLGLEDVAAADAAGLEAAAGKVGGEVALAGSLVWSDQALGWVADWRLASGGRTFGWRITGVSFDDAFRNGMRSAAQILSGHGEPR